MAELVQWRSSEVRTLLLTLTPVLARELLALNDPRRTLASDPAVVDLYASQMAEDRWLPTYAPIRVNVSGGLMDGQHRLQAIIKSGWSGPALILTGVPDHAAWAMDPPGPR